jgi:carboxyl-terminal processing protease
MTLSMTRKNNAWFRVKLWAALLILWACAGCSALVANAAVAGAVHDENVLDRSIRLIQEYYYTDIDLDALYYAAAQRICFTSPPVFGDRRPEQGDNSERLRRLLRDVSAEYGISLDLLELRAVDSMIKSLDHMSSVVGQEAFEEIRIGASGKFGGVGLVVNPKNGSYFVISAFEGSPAYNAGIKAGDQVLEIDGDSVEGLALNDVLQKVRGPVGSLIVLRVKTPGSGEKIFRLKRQQINIPSIRSALLPNQLAYLRVTNFQQTSGKEAAAALTKLGNRNVKGLIIDLRDNPGGLFSEAINLANLLAPPGKITMLRGRNPGLNRDFVSKGRVLLKKPIAILINKGTASASEILAGSLQGKPNVIILGQPSYGKASVQAVFPLNNGIALRLTTAHYYTPDGKDIEAKGLKPDIFLDDETAPPGIVNLETDPWIKKAMLYLGRKPGTFVTPY